MSCSRSCTVKRHANGLRSVDRGTKRFACEQVIQLDLVERMGIECATKTPLTVGEPRVLIATA